MYLLRRLDHNLQCGEDWRGPFKHKEALQEYLERCQTPCSFEVYEIRFVNLVKSKPRATVIWDC